MECVFYQSGQCRSCTQLSIAYALQLQTKQQQLQAQLAAVAPVALLEPVASSEQGFRNKAKMVVQGSAEQPILGIINQQRQAIDLTACPLYPEPFDAAFAHTRAFIQHAKLQPYDIAARRGELKYVLLSFSQASNRWLLRLVLRSQCHVAAIRKHLPWLQERWPELQVCSVNLQPEHKAVLEGETEIILTDDTMLAEQLNEIPLYLQPQSFFQTNPLVAAKLYRTAQRWLEPLALSSCWDLFCGVGGFALHLASNTMQVTGIEHSPAAIACARRSAAQMGLDNLEFQAFDATAFAQAQAQPPQLLVVNPPRRGLGKELCQSIETLLPSYLLYSSCNPDTLVADLAALPHFQLDKAQLFDMFPHTTHVEVLCLLKRRTD